ncbi:AmmeMemoRadiSam system radical SAM enzyme [bacterium]
MKEALFYKKLGNNTVQCVLCPHKCKIKNNALGICLARKNINEKLVSLSYGKITSSGMDPIEKKPLYHFYPGSQIFSIGSFGCNLKCNFCQNYSISQISLKDAECIEISSDKLLSYVQETDSLGVAYTYNEPLINYEYVLECAQLLKEHNYKNVFVTNGFINNEPLESIAPFIDAVNIDLKGFSPDYYKKICKGELDIVKDTIQILFDKNIHIELTNLLITDLNDDLALFEQMVDWIASLSDEIPFHISRCFPAYKCTKPATDANTLLKTFEIACKKLKYVYLGNMVTNVGNNTSCPKCGNLLIERHGYSTKIVSLKKNHCSKCHTKINILT